MTRRGASTAALLAAATLAAAFAAFESVDAQPPGNGARGPVTIAPDPRVLQRGYRFEETGEQLGFVVFVSSQVSADKENPLIVALHGLGGDANFIVRDRLVDFAEEGGYIVVGPLGYNVGGWYGSPIVGRGGRPIEPPNLAELSEKDVMTVLAMMREEFNVDDDRTYLMGHSMGGAGAIFLGQKYASQWAAVAALAPAAFSMEANRADYLAVYKSEGLPLMIVHGDADTAVPVENVRRWAATMAEMDLVQEYIELPGGDHATVKDDAMPAMYRFFEDHVRQPAGD